MYSRKTVKAVFVPVLLIAVAILAIAGCSSKNKQTDTPTNSTFTITSPSSMNAGTTAVIVASVKSGGTGVPDQVVEFSVTPLSAGHFSPTVDTTDANGEAASVFTANTTGSVTLTARTTVGGLVANAGMSIAQDQQQTGSGNINVLVTPSMLLANGSDTASVTISVRDGLGQPAPDSTLVRVVAGEKFVDKDGNGYWSQGVDSLVFDANGNGRWDAFGFIPSTAMVTGGSGQVTLKYVSGNDAITVYVKATVNDKGIVGFAETPLQLSPNASIASIYMSSDSMNLSVKQTGGIETALIRATGFDANGNTVPEGLTVNFIITDGPGGGEHLGNVGLGPYAAVTNSQGMATCPISSGTKSGTLRIRAYADTVLSEATQVMISAGPPQYIVVGSKSCNVPYWDVVAGKNDITAVVSDIYLNPVNDSTVVYFTTDEGTMMSHYERTKEHSGIATTTWFSGNNVATADGRVLVIAETDGGNVADTSMFFNTFFCDTLRVAGAPATMLADGASKAHFVITGVDFNGNPMIGGTQVEADANYMKVGTGQLEDGCYGSSARMTITSSALDMDHSMTGVNDDGIGATDVLTYWVGATAAVSVPVRLLTGYASSANSKINIIANAGWAESVDFTVTVMDRWGNPLGDHTLVFTASSGTVLGSTGKTDAYGEASGFRWLSPSADGKATISINDTDPRGGILLTTSVTVAAAK
jgi:hypothetical protein